MKLVIQLPRFIGFDEKREKGVDIGGDGGGDERERGEDGGSRR